MTLTSGTEKAPAHVDGRGEKAVPFGGAMAAADHHVMGDDDAARRHAPVSRVVGNRAADAAHQTACVWRKRGDVDRGGVFSYAQINTKKAHSCEKMRV